MAGWSPLVLAHQCRAEPVVAAIFLLDSQPCQTVAADPNTVELTSGAIGPPISSETSAPATGLGEPPRIWRTASATRPIPCTKPSAILPPAVLIGRLPPSTVRLSTGGNSPAARP